MNLPKDAAQLIRELHDKYHPNLTDPSWDEVYKFTKMVCAQLRFSLDNRDWVYLTHPQGHSDKIGYVDGNLIHYWDFILSAGGSQAVLNLTGIYNNFVDGQIPYDRMPSSDYLGGTSEPTEEDYVTREEFDWFKKHLSDVIQSVVYELERLVR